MTIRIDNARVENCRGPVWAVKYYGEVIHVTAPTQRDARRGVAELHPTRTVVPVPSPNENVTLWLTYNNRDPKHKQFAENAKQLSPFAKGGN